MLPISRMPGVQLGYFALLVLAAVSQASAGEAVSGGHAAGETQDAIRNLLVDELTMRWYPRDRPRAWRVS